MGLVVIGVGNHLGKLITFFGPGRFGSMAGFLVSFSYFRSGKVKQGLEIGESYCENKKKPVTPPNRPSKILCLVCALSFYRSFGIQIVVT